jgi:hypothetical protein
MKQQMLDVELEQSAKIDPKVREDYTEIIRLRQLSRTLPFDQRNEVSADAKYIADRIVKHMWIICIGVPVVAGLLFLVLNIK